MNNTNTAPRKMVAKYAGHCPICDHKIKSGSDSIRYAADEPVAHWDCYDRAMSADVPSYYAEQQADDRARWDAAVAKRAERDA